MATVAEALASVRERIDRASERAGRPTGDVRLVAVSKTMPVARIRRLIEAGHRLLGENRVQEALDKISTIGNDAAWHLIGHLQRNKVRHVVGAFDLLHGVDSVALATEIDRRAAAAGLRQAVLIQVNVAREPTKHGADPTDLPSLLETTAGLQHVDLRGLMAIPPPVDRAETARPWFVRLRNLRDEAETRLGCSLPELSMGMTDDFEVAVEEGATLVRVGRAIFGERDGNGPDRPSIR